MAAADDDVAATIPPWQAARSSGPQPTRAPTFADGALIGGRYRIERFVAFGGMGEVYAALDTELGEQVALKTIRQEVAENPRVVERFKREIALARKVTHRNVCRIFDLGTHKAESGASSTFLTMELLNGPSLGEQIAATGPMPSEQALPLLRQMADALAAAHQVGIVHRDFKSGNVILVPDGPPGSPPRVVVTDFGLARASEADPFSTNAEGDAGMVGSPVYMAPEQVEGGPVDQTADVYALGVVLFELLTANIPFTGETAMAIAVKRIKEPAPSPRMFAPTLDPRWEAAVLRCLERVPAARFASSQDVVRFLVGEEIGGPLPSLPATRPRAPSKTRRWIAAGAAASALGLGAYGLLRKPAMAPSSIAVPAPGTTKPRRSLAVIGFSNVAQKPDQEWISTALSEMFTTDLGTGGKLRLVPGESVGRMKQELQLSSAASYAPDTLEKIKRNLDADLVIVGSYVGLGKQLRIDVRMQDAATGETLAQIAETTTEADMASVVTRVSAQLRDKLQIAQQQRGEGTAFVNTALPQNPEAAKLYSEALGKIRLFRMADARNLLERAIQIEPSFPLAHAALYEALNYLGAESKAHEAIKEAFDRREPLPTEARLRVEGLYYFEFEDKQRRLDAYTQLYQMAPDNIEHAMEYISALSAVDEKAGVAMLEKIAKTPQAQKEPRFLFLTTALAYAKHDFETVLDISNKLEKAGIEKGTLSFVGEAKNTQVFAHWFLGNLREGLLAADEAKRIAFTMGDRDGEATTLTNKAFIQSDMGDLLGAQKSSEDALEAAADIGSRRRVWLAQHTLARSFTFRGDLREGMKQFEASRQTAVEQGSKYGEAVAYIGIAATQIFQGELPTARQTLDKILFQSRLFAPKNAIAYVQHFRGELFREMGDWKEARAAFEEAMKVREEFHDKFQAMRDRLGLARVALAEGRLDEAQALGDKAAKLFYDIGDHDDEAFTQCLLVRVALAKKQPTAATAPLERAMAIAAKSQSAMVKLDTTHTRAELLAATGKQAEAVKLLDDAITLANDKGLIGYALAMRKTRVELQAAKASQDEKSRLREEADRRGYAWIAMAPSLR